MTSKERVERGDAIVVGGLGAAQESLLQNSGVCRVAVAGVGGARVDAGGVGVEDLKVSTHNRLAGVDVQNLEVVVDGNTLLVIDEILANVLSSNV